MGWTFKHFNLGIAHLAGLRCMALAQTSRTEHFEDRRGDKTPSIDMGCRVAENSPTCAASASVVSLGRWKTHS